MSISWIGSLLLVITLSMVAVAANYRDTALWRRNQISLDNAAIQMGQRDRAVLRKIQKVNTRLSFLNSKHDFFHACAKVPATAAACAPKDLALEVQMSALLLATEVRAYQEWEQTSHSAKYEKKRSRLILQKKNCPRCFRPMALEPEQKLMTTRLFIKNSPRDLESGYEILFAKDINYQLSGDLKE